MAKLLIIKAVNPNLCSWLMMDSFKPALSPNEKSKRYMATETDFSITGEIHFILCIKTPVTIPMPRKKRT